jgi:hypothetical protein
MDVQALVRRYLQQRRREYLAEGADDDDVGPPLPQFRQRLFRFQAVRLDDGQAQAEGGLLDRGRLQGPAPAGGTIRLGIYGYDVLTIGGEGLQGRHGETGGTHKNNAQFEPPAS